MKITTARSGAKRFGELGPQRSVMAYRP